MHIFKRIFLSALVLGLINRSLACKGCLSLDSYNFDKVIPLFKAVLVKFDVAYPYGEKHEEFTKFAEEIVRNKHVIAAEVSVKDYSDKENDDLAKRFDINTKDDFPVAILFKQDVKEFVRLPKDAKFTIEALRNLVRDNTDIYIGLPGCLEKFDDIAMKFVASDNKEKKLKDAEDIAAKIGEDEKKTAKTYLQYMKKVIDQGLSFVSKEQERLNKIIKDGKVNEKKKLELTQRLNVLHSFALKKVEL